MLLLIEGLKLPYENHGWEYIDNPNNGEYKDMKPFPCIPDSKLYIGYRSCNPYTRPINKGGLILCK